MRKKWQAEHRKKMISIIQRRHNNTEFLEQQSGVYRNREATMYTCVRGISEKAHNRKTLTTTANYDAAPVLKTIRLAMGTQSTKHSGRRVDMERIRKLGKNKKEYIPSNRFLEGDYRGLINVDYEKEISECSNSPIPLSSIRTPAAIPATSVSPAAINNRENNDSATCVATKYSLNKPKGTINQPQQKPNALIELTKDSERHKRTLTIGESEGMNVRF